MFSYKLFKAYRVACLGLSGAGGHPALDRPVSAWVAPGDGDVPERILKASVRSIVNSNYKELFMNVDITFEQCEKFVTILSRLERRIAADMERERIAGGLPRKRTASDARDSALAARYEEDRRAILAGAEHPLLRAPLAIWVRASDRYLPRFLLPLALKQILSYSFEELSHRKGVGLRRIGRIVEVIGRAREHLVVGTSAGGGRPEGPTGGGTVAGIVPTAGTSQAMLPVVPDEITGGTMLPSSPDEITEESWRLCTAIITRHGLENEPLGRIAPSLHDLCIPLWQDPLSTYTSLTLLQLKFAAGIGPVKMRQIVGAVLRIGRLLERMAPDEASRVRVLPAAIAAVLAWIERVRAHRDLPDIPTISARLVDPLLHQVEQDLSATAAEFLRRRLGCGDRPREVLETIGRDRGITRERVRQIIAQVPEMFEVRCPQAKHWVVDFFDHLQASHETAEPVELVGRVLDSLFGVSVPGVRGASPTDLLKAWERAGKQKITPLCQNELERWLDRECPDLSRRPAVRQLTELGPTYTDEAGVTWFFSNQPLDRLLHHLFTTTEPLPEARAAEMVGCKPLNFPFTVRQDPRFIEDESHRVLPAERHGFFRRSGAWHLRLEPSPIRGAKLRADAVSLDQIIHFIISGLTALDIADAPVWGVHRFVNEMLGRFHDARLARLITPAMLPSMLAKTSDGLIRHMSRLRLRWDPANASLEARGQGGWIDYVVSRAGVPMLQTELRSGLEQLYQDSPTFDAFSLNATRDTDSGEGELVCKTRFVFEPSSRLPILVIPRGWTLAPEEVNVSEGIKQLIAEIIRSQSRNAYTKRDFVQVPWFLELIERRARGTMRRADESGAEVGPIIEPATPAGAEPPSPHHKATAGSEAFGESGSDRRRPPPPIGGRIPADPSARSKPPRPKPDPRDRYRRG